MAGLPKRILPYRQLSRDVELELVPLADDREIGIETTRSPPPASNRWPFSSQPSSSSPPASSPNEGGAESLTSGREGKTPFATWLMLVLGSMVAAGVQFGWALQLSLLTPYIQTLGIEHAFSSFIWLCGPITGLVVQPCVGIWSDKCDSKFGRRRPFIFVGSLMISAAVTMIGFSADIGYLLGDTGEHCRTYKGPRWRAAAVFVIGFWMLDLANNTVQGPARALLADIAGPSKCNSANAIFCFWMAVGNILGFSAGANGQWHRWFPFLTTRACCEACGNLKAAFLVAVVFLMFCTSITLYFAKEIPLSPQPSNYLCDSAPLLKISNEENGPLDVNSGKEDSQEIPIIMNIDKDDIDSSSGHESKVDGEINIYSDGPSSVLVNLLTSLRHLPPGMHAVLLVMALTWLAWFPFFLFDTDWMGRELYHGNPNGNSTDIKNYHDGVREGAFGLLLNSVVLLFSSFLVEPLCNQIGAGIVWAISNFVIFACMIVTAILSVLSQNIGWKPSINVASLILFSILGFPLSITYSVPFSMTAELTAGTGGGQGLATGVLNLSIVVPQMIVSLGAGPWDALFGGGNIPAFALASVFSFTGGVVAILKLPRLPCKPLGFHAFG